MTEKRISIYVGQPIADVIAAIGAEYVENRSGRLNTVCERYLAMVADELARIELTRAEWCAVMAANNDVSLYVGHPDVPSMIWANVHDNRGLDKKWNIDQAALVGKLQRLSHASLIAIREACDRFWSHSETPTDAALDAIGVTSTDK